MPSVEFLDIVRAASIMSSMYCLIVVPVIIWKRTRNNRNMVVEISFIIGICGLLIGRVAQSISRWDQPYLVWYGAPLTLVSCLFLARSAEIGGVFIKNQISESKN